MERVLENLFGSPIKVKLLRLFLQNTEQFYSFKEIIKILKIPNHSAHVEIGKLLNIGLLKIKIVSIRKEVPRAHGKKKIITQRVHAYYVDSKFWFLQELRSLITKTSADSKQRLIPKLKRLGNVKLAIISGVFLNNDTTRTDLLIVGDKIKKSKLDHFLSNVESEIGKSLRYTFMDTPEFRYRLDMYDRFLRDILEYPHEKLINRVNV